MKNGFVLLMALTLTGGAAFADAPFDVTNPSFEDSTITWQEPDYWTLFFGGGAAEPVYHEGDPANANYGEDYVEIINNGIGWAGIHMEAGQEVDVSYYDEVEMSIWARSADGSTITNGLVMKLEFYATQGEGYVDGSTPVEEIYLDVSSTWTPYSLTATIPAGMNYARGVLITPFEQPGAAVYVDDMWISQFPIPCDPVACGTPLGPNPANGSIQSALNAPAYGHLPVTQLSWSFYSPNTLGVRVRFEKEPTGVYDPNWTSGVYTALANDAQTVDLSTLTTLPLDDDSLYSWQVETTDSSRINGDWVVEGNVWLFRVGCPYDIVGHVDNNCLVNLVDVSMMAANWLIDCINDPADPACIVP
jgi:hypothetical protein